MIKIGFLLAGAMGIASIFAASVCASPYWTMYRVQASIDNKDVRAFSHYVDLPEVKHNIEAQMRAALQSPMKQVATQMKRNGPSDAAVDTWRRVLPLDALMQQIDAQISLENIASILATGEASQVWPTRSEPAARDLALNYRAWNQVVFTPKNEPEGHGFIFKRAGLWEWKLVGLNFGMEAAVQ